MTTLATFDPTTGQLISAVIGGGFLALSATIAGIFSWLNGSQAKKAVVAHVEDESGVIQRYEATMSRMDAKLDDILEWQGHHDALHARLH